MVLKEHCWHPHITHHLGTLQEMCVCFPVRTFRFMVTTKQWLWFYCMHMLARPCKKAVGTEFQYHHEFWLVGICLIFFFCFAASFIDYGMLRGACALLSHARHLSRGVRHPTEACVGVVRAHSFLPPSMPNAPGWLVANPQTLHVFQGHKATKPTRPRNDALSASFRLFLLLSLFSGAFRI